MNEPGKNMFRYIVFNGILRCTLSIYVQITQMPLEYFIYLIAKIFNKYVKCLND